MKENAEGEMKTAKGRKVRKGYAVYCLRCV
jgi:hypothetical protein